MTELITICNVLCTDNSDFLHDSTALYELNVLKSNILHEDISNTDMELLNESTENSSGNNSRT